MNKEDKITNQKSENILVPLDTDKKVSLALGIYIDGKRKLLSLPTVESLPTEFPGFTAEACKGLALQAKRLKKQGLRMESREEWMVSTRKKGLFQQRPKRIMDGGCLYGIWSNRMQNLTSFVREKKKEVGAFRDNYLVNFELLETSEEDLRVVSETRREQEEIFGRSCEYWKKGRWTLEKLGVGFYLFCLGSLSLVHLGSLVVFVLSVCGKIDNADVLATAFFFWVVSIFGVAPLGVHCLKMVSSFRRRRASAKVVQQIREVLPDFCRGDFVSMAESRIKALLFADSFQEVGEFVNGDVHGFLSTHSYAVNYESQNFWFQSFWQDVDNLHIEVMAEALISLDLGIRMGRIKEYIKVHFTKPVNGIMAGDWYVEKVEVVDRNGK